MPNATTAASDTGASRRNVELATATGVSSAATPSTSDRLAMFDPTMLPTPSSASPPMAANVEISSSGTLVPSPMTTAPTSTGATSSRADNAAAPSTKTSAALTSTARPTMVITRSSATSTPISEHAAGPTECRVDRHGSVTITSRPVRPAVGHLPWGT